MMYLTQAFAILLLVAVLPIHAQAAEAPHEIAGIRLGSNVEDYPDIEYTDYLKDVVVMNWHGFRKGIISHGICYSPGTIVRIRMKYEDSSKEYFDTLMKRFKKKFGPPTEWKGDSFGIKHTWKWVFKDNDGQIVNMILQHNLQDANDNIGNMIKLSYPELIENERICFIRQCEEITDPDQKKRKELLKETNWDYLIPK